jgi:hypothetical protein
MYDAILKTKVVDSGVVGMKRCFVVNNGRLLLVVEERY